MPTKLEFSTLYADLPYGRDPFDQGSLRYQGLRKGINAPLPLELRTDEAGSLIRSVFTTDLVMRDLLRDFEASLELSSRLYIADAVNKGNPEPILRLIGSKLPHSVDGGLSPNELTEGDLKLIKRCFLRTFSRRASTKQLSGFSTFEIYRHQEKLTPISALELATWIAVAYRNRLPEFPELAKKIKEINQVGESEDPNNSRPNLRILPFDN